MIVFMIVSSYGFAGTFSSPRVVFDPSRVAARVVSGIGFLGAGAIPARGEVAHNLTTAASIWTVAAVGFAVGVGLTSPQSPRRPSLLPSWRV